MPVPTITFRTNGAWGVGIGMNLTPTQVDVNFYNIQQSIQDLIDNPLAPVEISDISVQDNFLTITMSDYSTFGPFLLPVATFQDRGEWLPLTEYVYADIFTQGAGLYLVLQDHTSSGSFNANAGNMQGPYYRLLFSGANLMLEWRDVWADATLYNPFDLFSVPDDGVYLVLIEHTSEAPFDPLAQDDSGNDLYQKVFQAIETEVARIQAQFPGTQPSDSSSMLVYIQDDDRDLVFAENFPESSAHLEVAVTATLEYPIMYDGNEIGMITFSPGDLLDGDGGQFATITGDGATIEHGELLRILAPDTSDATARFMTVALRGSYAAATS